MSLKEWKKRMLKKEYHDLKQEQGLRAAVKSALACRRNEAGRIMEDLQTNLDELEEVFHKLMGSSPGEGGVKNSEDPTRTEPLARLWEIIQHLLDLHDQLKEMTEEEEKLVRELNMERERIAEEVEEVSERISAFNSEA